LILELVKHARSEAARREVELTLSMTTNGTLDSPASWSLMMLSDMQLAVSHDGLPSVHDRHRVTIDGQPSSRKVQETMARLVHERKDFRVVMVVRPDNVETLPAGLDYLYECGVRRLTLARPWTSGPERTGASRYAISRAADFWQEHLPECSVSWFGRKGRKIGPRALARNRALRLRGR